MDANKSKLPYFIFVFILVSIYLVMTLNAPKKQENIEIPQLVDNANINHNVDINIGNSALNYANLPINPLSEYDFMTKDEIYEIRTTHVMNSIFASPKYKPSQEVFGQIEDGKPWYGANFFPCGHGEVTSGASYRSKFINNPTALIDVSNDMLYRNDSEDSFCKNTKTWLLLVDKLTYDKDKKLITAVYKLDNTFLYNNPNKRSSVLDFGAVNAKDFGYIWGYAYEFDNLEFQQSTNVGSDIYSFKDFIHTGSSCGVPGGCNNHSPWQKELDFHLTSLPASATFKLWKKLPRSKEDEPDIYFKVIMVDKNAG